MKPALITRLLVEEYYNQSSVNWVNVNKDGMACSAPYNYLTFLKSIASGKQRNSNVVRGYRQAVAEILGQ